MRAIVQTAYGEPESVLELRDVPRPVPGSGEALVRVHATSVHPDVWHVVTGSPLPVRIMAGLRRPKTRIPGTDMAGVVEAVGDEVTDVAPGAEVFGETIATDRQWTNGAAYAEYVAVPVSRLRPKPASVTFSGAATVPTTGTIAFQTLIGGARVQPGDRVLVNGAAGGVGSVAVQMAKAYGAHVTGVDSGHKLDAVRAIGADGVIDYTTTDFTETGDQYDVILDVASVHPHSAVSRALAPGGRYELVGHDHYGASGTKVGNLGHMIRTTTSAAAAQRGQDRPARIDDRPAMTVLAELLDAGDLVPMVDRTYDLADAAEAIRYLTTGAARGRIVLAVAESPDG